MVTVRKRSDTIRQHANWADLRAFGAPNDFNRLLFIGVEWLGLAQPVENIADIAVKPSRPVN